ncbi:hypothetical protein [Mucilaginibacter rubeus]|uniref:Uncharacterized protein n=1 Tax=Mucilaginibacter rubeus TaxID=2027860 RepID=A0A5C1I0M0_9SPHI|nr:hypothetical protein [Mucilaginibacter rubeus]QEM11717.1 hypothetical protein DEO27_017345 [Mucilaginibacter rubeus]
MLKVSNLIGIKAESGGLLKLILLWLPRPISGLDLFKTQFFRYLFHFATGAAMVFVYHLTLEKSTIRVFWKGVVFSCFPWLVNGLIVLPLLHQGVLGIGQLSVSGIIYFFFANLAFGLSLVYVMKILKHP